MTSTCLRVLSLRESGRQMPRLSSFATVVFVILVVSLAAGCSVRKFAATRVGNVLAESGSVYASDDDPALVSAALPFGLKTMEGLLVEVPKHRGLLIAAASGFTQYAYAFVDLPAFALEETQPRRSRELRLRAKNLYLRGRNYGVRALELREPGFPDKLRQDPKSALAVFKAENVPELYWTAVSWSAAIATDKQDMDLLADLDLISPMIDRCLELDEDFDQGAIHAFLITFYGSRSAAQGGSVEKAREHFERAIELASGNKVGPLVSLAESVSVPLQNRQEFVALLRQALAFDVDTAREHRLANLIAQRRAAVLLSRIDDFFI